MARLYVLSGPDIGKSFAVEAGMELGRSAECALHLRDASVSRRHARIERADGAWSISDLGSRNGLRVAGERVGRAELTDGCELQVGEVLVRFRSEVPEAVEQATAAVTVAPHVAPAPAPAQHASDADEITLEGDWDDSAAAHQPPARAQDAPAPLAPAQPAPLPMAAQAQQVVRRTPAELPSTARATPQAPPGFATAGKGVLQYHRVENRAGLFNAEVGQLSPLAKLALALVALALFAGMFYAVFAGTALLKRSTQSHAPGDETELDAER